MKNYYGVKIFIIVLLGLLMPKAAISATATWTQIGPTLIGATYTSLAVGPINQNIMYAGSKVTTVGAASGLYKTTDGGVTWNLISFRNQTVDRIVTDPITPNILYVTVGGSTIFKSIDGGATWSTIMVAGIHGLGQLFFRANILYFKGLGLSKSLDGGVTWIPLFGGSLSIHPRSIAIDPANPSNLLLSTVNGILKSTDGGLTGTLSNTGLPISSLLAISHLKYDPFNPGVVYAINRGTIYKSLDGGVTWAAFSNWSGSLGSLDNLYFDSLRAGVIYAASSTGSYLITDPFNGATVTPRLSAIYSVYKSTDGGTTWIPSADGTQRGWGGFPVSDLIVRGGNMHLAFSQGIFRESSTFSELQIAIKNNPGPIKTGSPVSYNIKAINNGPDNATGVAVTDTLPASTTLISATSTTGACTSLSGIVTCNVGNLAAGASATINLSITPSVAGNMTNAVAITGTQPDPFSADNSANTVTQITSPPPPPPPVPAPAPSGGGGCVLSAQSGFDPMLPVLVLIAGVYLIVRRRKMNY